MRIPCSNIVKKGEEAYQTFQLEGKGFFSFVKGDIGLKVFTSLESEPTSSPSPQPALPSNLPHKPPISEAKSLVTYTVFALPTPKNSSTNAPKAISPESGKEISNFSVIQNLDSSITAPADESKKEAEGAVEVHKHQVLQQPGVSVGKRPEGVLITMHRQVNPQANPTHEEDYELKDTNPQLGERWLNGGVEGGGWVVRGSQAHMILLSKLFIFMCVL